MVFSCNGCHKTYPDREEQTGTVGNPKYCSDCYDPEEHAEEDDDDGPNAKVQEKDEDEDDPHPWEGFMGPYGRTP